MKKLAVLFMMFVGTYAVNAQTSSEEKTGTIKTVSANMEKGTLISEEGEVLEFINSERVEIKAGDEITYQILSSLVSAGAHSFHEIMSVKAIRVVLSGHSGGW